MGMLNRTRLVAQIERTVTADLECGWPLDASLPVGGSHAEFDYSTSDGSSVYSKRRK